MNYNAEKPALPSDNPVHHESQDILNRSSFSKIFASQVLGMDFSEGAVVSILGEWGSGKTSFINLTRGHFEGKALVFDFNPWMFSGTEQLIGAFFEELITNLKLENKLKDIGDKIEKYAQAIGHLKWLPVLGQWLDSAEKTGMALSALMKPRQQSLTELKEQIEASLNQISKPIIIIIDDIDRLNTGEIRQIFQLIRLTANFPNIIYLAAFDRSIVESALNNKGFSGRAYLEKITQICIDLPAVPDNVINTQILTALENAVIGIEQPGPFDDEIWPDIFFEIIRPLVKNIRDVRRLSLAVRGTLSSLNGQVAQQDVLALEAIRVFLPDVFNRIRYSIEGLTCPSGSYESNHSNSHLEAQVKSLIEASDKHSEVAQALIHRLFPAGSRHVGGSNYDYSFKDIWAKKRLVAHKPILKFYLELSLNSDLSAMNNAHCAWNILNDQKQLEAFISNINKNEIQDTISALEAYRDEYRSEHIIPASVVFLNIMYTIPERQGGLYEISPRVAVTRVILRLLRTTKDEDKTLNTVRKILSQLTSLSARLELILLIGHHDNIGHKLVSQEIADSIEGELWASLKQAPIEALVKEPALLSLYLFFSRWSISKSQELEIPCGNDFTMALLASARSEMKSQITDHRSIIRTPYLQWDCLIEIFGDEEAISKRLEITDLSSGSENELISLAKKHLSGWCPQNAY